MNLIDSHASLQSSHSCNLNTFVGVVKLTYLHVVVKCESLLGGYSKARCTVSFKLITLELTMIFQRHDSCSNKTHHNRIMSPAHEFVNIKLSQCL